MARMFQGATAFLQDGIRNWSVPAGAGVTDMFSSATAWLTMYRQPDFSASRDGPPSVWVRPGPFTSLIQLKAAVSSCLAASPSGACNCDSAPVDCGPAVYDGITQWNTALITDMSELFKECAIVQCGHLGVEYGCGDEHALCFKSRAFNQDILLGTRTTCGSWLTRSSSSA